MKILVTGGAGFIGSHLVDKLVKEGHDVLVVDDLSTGKKEYVNPRAKFKKVNIEQDKLATVIDEYQPEIIYHLAAQKNVRVSLSHPSKDALTNVVGSLNVLEQAVRNQVKKFIFVSTGGIYGDTDQLPTNESGLEQPMSPYILNKLTFEKYLDIWANGKIKWAAPRLANVYGPRQDPYGEAGVIAIFLDNALKDKTLYVNGDGQQTRDFIYINDVVETLVKALGNIEGVYNIGTGKETSLLDLIAAIKVATGKEIKVYHRDAIAGEVKRSCLDANKAMGALNWKPQYELKEGLGHTYRWFKDNKK